MNKERLLKLSTLLASVPDEKFNIASWRMDEHGEENGEKLGDESLLDTGCGTSGCAVGWACAMPEFQAEGLVWTAGGPGLLAGDALSFSGWDAVKEFFDLDHPQAQHLFSGSEYEEDRFDGPGVTPGDVSERIRKWVKAEST